ncbi:right-handed parallel beta-helix repeat-containing protein [Arthrobacter sp. 35W]|uniref:right-handed parallel beta-helix repeat-containing protein n=1 Tax=Arthrobacter sp. 35W TaxID=1132441 RepID=UPI000685E98A|nr:right-handed parallel beta-helix repeat-containing protein [Arthrobacter sp. 35W]
MAVAVGTAVLGATLSALPASAAAPNFVHVDCSAAPSGVADGSQRAPYTTLEEANAITLKAGDRIRFKRGATCLGTFAPKGSGTSRRPISIGAYGPGRARPVIDGDGAADTILLRNMAGVEISGLEVTNAKGPASLRRGVYLLLEDFGTANHMVVDDLYVHDINGNDAKDIRGSGGILASVGGEAKASNYNDLQITNNRVEHVTRTGIAAVASLWAQRAEVGSTVITKPWTGNTGIVISNNNVLDTGGDGIVPQTALDAVVEHNRVHKFQQRSAGYNAGIWPWNSDGTAFRFNEVSGGATTRDGMAFDIDQGTDRTLFEYNYSHDNAGGFFLVCNAAGRVANAVVRYNISQNDTFRGIETCSGGIESAEFYNNTIYIGPGISQTVINENNANQRNVGFRNNIVVKEGAGTASLNLRSGGFKLATNNFVNVGGAEADTTAVNGDPRLLARGTASGIDSALGYKLHRSSPLLAAGQSIAGNGGRDYFGNAVPATGPVSIGAYNGPGVHGPAPEPIPGPAVPPGPMPAGRE